MWRVGGFFAFWVMRLDGAVESGVFGCWLGCVDERLMAVWYADFLILAFESVTWLILAIWASFSWALDLAFYPRLRGEDGLHKLIFNGPDHLQ
ncbi:hypothetical protein [Pseudomonas cichorii]|uniref:hypothetical protein n=1 Tax=Pseudomonas cichorii TaxID=36746 RepID=UPI000EFE406B|nr:hypothetical protein [Pseudomonas cichorii]